jgi:aminoglycoside/choline kinase family phosphotransferase
MPEWFCERHLGVELSAAERALLAEAFEILVQSALAQPRVFVHRDYPALSRDGGNSGRRCRQR